MKLGIAGTLATVVAVFKIDVETAQQLGIASSGLMFAGLLATVLD